MTNHNFKEFIENEISNGMTGFGISLSGSGTVEDVKRELLHMEELIQQGKVIDLPAAGDPLPHDIQEQINNFHM